LDLSNCAFKKLIEEYHHTIQIFCAQVRSQLSPDEKEFAERVQLTLARQRRRLERAARSRRVSAFAKLLVYRFRLAIATSRLLTAHITEAPKPPIDLRPDINPAMNKVILRCLGRRIRRRGTQTRARYSRTWKSTEAPRRGVIVGRRFASGLRIASTCRSQKPPRRDPSFSSSRADIRYTESRGCPS